jgi:hypothetical protein
MRYTKPTILSSRKASTCIASITSDKTHPVTMDNPNDQLSFGTSAAYEADE